jgi:hypothetical protein
MTRVGRRSVAWLCLSALLFLQLAVAAYACPTRIDGGTPTLAAMDSSAQPCAGTDQERPKLCEQHCIHGSQSVDTQPHSSVGAPVLPLMTVAVVPDLHRSIKLNAYGTFRVTAVEPPPLVRFGVLRI